MKAAVIQKHGGLDVLQVQDVSEPQALRDDVVVRLHAAALNHIDLTIRSGTRSQMQLPHILGSDGSGVVAAVGPDVRNLRQGDPVIIHPGLWCGRCEHCARGQQSECIEFGIVGMSSPGTFAEYIALPERNFYPKPDYLSWPGAAALGVAYLTAWRMITTRARLAPGETVLIHGIGGGVAVAALQLAKLLGAQVIVTSSSDEKLSKAAQLGADHGVNYAKSTDLVLEVMDLVNGRGVDVVIDSVGAATWEVNLQVVRKGGRVVNCGVNTGATAPTDIQALYWKQITVMGSTLGSDHEFRQLLRACRATKLQPSIDSVFPLEQVRQAQAIMESSQQFGKIVLTME
jgi:NADPH:quinone reductase-like Zn-dependent oxidoreductase